MTVDLIEGEIGRQKHTQTKDSHVKMEEYQVIHLQVEEYQGLQAIHQKLEKARKNLSPIGFRGSVVLQTPVNSRIEIIHFCCKKTPSLWYLIMAALENGYSVHHNLSFE